MKEHEQIGEFIEDQLSGEGLVLFSGTCTGFYSTEWKPKESMCKGYVVNASLHAASAQLLSRSKKQFNHPFYNISNTYEPDKINEFLFQTEESKPFEECSTITTKEEKEEKSETQQGIPALYDKSQGCFYYTDTPVLNQMLQTLVELKTHEQSRISKEKNGFVDVSTQVTCMKAASATSKSLQDKLFQFVDPFCSLFTASSTCEKKKGLELVGPACPTGQNGALGPAGPQVLKFLQLVSSGKLKENQV